MSEDPVKDWLSSTIPEKLWHYTSVTGFQGIVSSKKIFATDLRFLNDRTEFVHAKKTVQAVIDNAGETDENGFRTKDTLQDIVSNLFGSGLLSFERLQVFTASFSLAEDQLSQWRGYSRGSSGVSLGFDLRKLRPPSAVGTLATFAPCVYSEEKKIELITHVLVKAARDVSSSLNEEVSSTRDLVRDMREASPNLTSEEIADKLRAARPRDPVTNLRKALVTVGNELLKLAGLLKDSSFEEEREWRLVLPVFTEKTLRRHPRLFRPGATALIPYIAFPLSPGAAEGQVPLTDLILGPGTDPLPAAVDSARSFLLSGGISVMPRESRVPFRSF
jgi:Protein of unknown function (DUF2971)